jgi:hypothetical protein
MSHDIESNFTEEYWNEEKQCQYCDSLETKDEKCYCHEFEVEVPLVAHCDFFRSKD